MKKEAIGHYHSLLTEESAGETYRLLEGFLKDRKLFFGGRPLCTVLRPHFYTEEQFHYLKAQTELILQAFSRLHQACMADSSRRARFFLEPWEEEMMHVHRPAQIPWSTSRLDSFYSLDHETLQFIEYNAETPAGMGYEDVLAETFLDLPLMKKFQEKYAVRALPVRDRLLQALLDTYEQWLGRKPDQPPQIAIVDWEDVPTRNEHRLCQEWFEKHGVRSMLSSPLNLVFKNGQLFDGNFRIDLIYKRVLAQELFQKMGNHNPIFEALRKQAVCISNSLQALLLYKKCSLAYLSDEKNYPLFTAEQIGAIQAHIPWTRVLEERKTTYGKTTVDLVPFVNSNREKLVLKPNDSYGGKGVVLGWDTSAEEWSKAVQQAITEPYVVQEKVNIASEVYPSYASGKLQFHQLYVDADPFIFMGTTVGGTLTRLSSAALLNVTAGHGSAIPTFVIRQ